MARQAKRLREDRLSVTDGAGQETVVTSFEAGESELRWTNAGGPIVPRIERRGQNAGLLSEEEESVVRLQLPFEGDNDHDDVCHNETS